MGKGRDAAPPAWFRMRVLQATTVKRLGRTLATTAATGSDAIRSNHVYLIGLQSQNVSLELFAAKLDKDEIVEVEHLQGEEERPREGGQDQRVQDGRHHTGTGHKVGCDKSFL